MIFIVDENFIPTIWVRREQHKRLLHVCATAPVSWADDTLVHCACSFSKTLYVTVLFIPGVQMKIEM